MAGVVGALLFLGRVFFKKRWARMIFKDYLTWEKCFGLAVAGLVSAFILGPVISQPQKLIKAIKDLRNEHKLKEAAQ